MYDIRPNEGIGGLTSLAVHYGDEVAKGIQQQGQIIEQGLQRISTTKELQGLGQVLTQLDPKTPDYTQKLIELKSAFPLAASDPRGQAMVGMGFKDHLQWQQSQQTLQRAQALYGIQNPTVNVGGIGGAGGGAPLPVPMAGGLPESAAAAPDNTSPLASIATGGMSNVAPQSDEPSVLPPISDTGSIPKGLSAYNRAVLQGRTGDITGMPGSLRAASASNPIDTANQILAPNGGPVSLKERNRLAAQIGLKQITEASKQGQGTSDFNSQLQASGFTPVENKPGIYSLPAGGEYEVSLVGGKLKAVPAKQEKDTPWKLGADGLLYRTKADGSPDVMPVSDLGVEAKKQMTPYQQAHLQEMQDRIAASGNAKKIESLQKDMASLQTAITAVNKDASRAAELPLLQRQFETVKGQRDALLDAAPASKKLRYDPTSGTLVPQ